MKVTISEDRKTATDINGAIYILNGITIKKERGSDNFYSHTTSFFKAACSPNTTHYAMLLPDEKINII